MMNLWNLFSFNKKSKEDIIGKCKYNSNNEIFDYFKFNQLNKSSLELFLNNTYDFDFTENGVDIWEEIPNITSPIRRWHFKYDYYILKDLNSNLYSVHKDIFNVEFKKL